MTRTTRLKANENRYDVFDFTGGLNNKYSNIIIADNEASDLLNVVFETRGVLRKRPGVVPFTSYPSKPSVGILQTQKFTLLNGNFYVLVFFLDGTISVFDAQKNANFNVPLQNSDASLFNTTGHHSNKPFSAFVMNSTLYFGNSTDGWFKFLGRDTTANTYYATNVPALPKADFSIVKDNRAFFMGDPTARDSIYFSDLANPESYSATINDTVYGGTTTSTGGGIIRVVTQTDDAVVGASIFNDELIIFKRDSVHVLSGNIPNSNYKLSQLNIKTGCIAPNTIARGDNMIFYLGEDGVYVVYVPIPAQVEVTPLSDKITPEFTGLDPTKFRGVYSNSKYYLFYNDPTNAKVLIYDVRLKNWTKWDLCMSHAYYDADYEQMLMGNSNGYVYKLDQTKLHDEFTPNNYTPINAYYQTKYFNLNIPEVTKRFRWIKTFFKPNEDNGSVLYLDISIDYLLTEEQLAVSDGSMIWGTGVWGVDTWGASRDEESKTVRFGGLGETIQFRYSNGALDEDLYLYGFALGYKTKVRVR